MSGARRPAPAPRARRPAGLVVAGVASVAAEVAVDQRKLLSAAIAWMGRPSN